MIVESTIFQKHMRLKKGLCPFRCPERNLEIFYLGAHDKFQNPMTTSSGKEEIEKFHVNGGSRSRPPTSTIGNLSAQVSAKLSSNISSNLSDVIL